jgi:hypothetical protein
MWQRAAARPKQSEITMISVSIGGVTISPEQATEAWIDQMMVDARRRKVPLCVRVTVNLPGIQVDLATMGCGDVRSPPKANAAEQRIIAAWHWRGIGMGQFSPTELRLFLSELARITTSTTERVRVE